MCQGPCAEESINAIDDGTVGFLDPPGGQGLGRRTWWDGAGERPRDPPLDDIGIAAQLHRDLHTPGRPALLLHRRPGQLRPRLRLTLRSPAASHNDLTFDGLGTRGFGCTRLPPRGHKGRSDQKRYDEGLLDGGAEEDSLCALNMLGE